MKFSKTWWTNLWAGVCTNHWVAFLLRNYSALELGISGYCLEFRMVTAWLYFSCDDSRYSPPAWLQVEWRILKIRESLVLDSHWPLLADGNFWNIKWGIQVFPALSVGGVICVKAILDCTQTASRDWWTRGMFTPAQQNKHFFWGREKVPEP